MSTGRLIVIEGLDGAGTTTQTKRVVAHLNDKGVRAHATREPSDGPIGKLIREMLTGGHAIPDQSLSQSTFGLLFAADRLDHLQREVEPAIAAGAIECDRSTFVAHVRRLRPVWGVYGPGNQAPGSEP